MAKRESYAPGTPSWVDLATNDQAAAKSFYSGLFGWSYDDMSVGDDVFYSMALSGGAAVGAIAPQQPEQLAAGVPPHWQMYITVDDVDKASELVEGAGGSVHVPPFDVMDAGRMSVITDPSGAFFMLWTAKNTIGAGVVNEPGAFTWSELVAPPNDRTASFYETVTGLKLISVPMPDGSGYDGFTLDGTADTMVAGTLPPPMPGMPPHWAIYFGAEDVDASAAKVSELGGKVFMEPFDIPVGRMAVVADPQGAMFNLFRMAPAGDLNPMSTDTPIQFRLVTRYAAASPDAADENQRRIEGVFAELAETKPDNVTYIVLRLPDDSFVHLSFHGHGHDDPNPITGLAAFQHFGDDHASRRAGGVDQKEAQLVGAYITTIA